MQSLSRKGVLLFVVTGLVGVGAARATTLRVPSEYATMNAALDSAASGDTVLVAPGVYTEYETRPTGGFGLATAMAFVPDGVLLRSEGGSQVTELRHGVVAATAALAVWIESAASGTTAVEGFKVTNSLTARGGFWVRLSSVAVRNCEFAGLDLQGLNLWLSDAVIEDCTFEDCTGSSGGGGVGSIDGTIFITRCTFRNCAPGGVSLTGGNNASVADYAEIRDCLFDGNTSGSGGGGGLRIAKYQTGSIVDRCVFVNNTSTGYGGAIVMSATSTGGVTVSNSVFSGNQGDTFGGAVMVGPSGIVTGNTFYDNTVTNPFEGGGAAAYLSSGGNHQLRDNVIAGTHGGFAIALVAGSVASSCNIYWDNPDGIGFNYTMQATDQVADPLFCDAPNGDLTVQENSPCLPGNSGSCGQIGALGEGCGTVSIQGKSWGGIKAGYRGTEVGR